MVYTAEFANAGFLRPFRGREGRLTDGMLPAPVATGMWKDTLRRTVQDQHAVALVPQVIGRGGRGESGEPRTSPGTR